MCLPTYMREHHIHLRSTLNPPARPSAAQAGTFWRANSRRTHRAYGGGPREGGGSEAPLPPARAGRESPTSAKRRAGRGGRKIISTPGVDRLAWASAHVVMKVTSGRAWARHSGDDVHAGKSQGLRALSVHAGVRPLNRGRGVGLLLRTGRMRVRGGAPDAAHDERRVVGELRVVLVRPPAEGEALVVVGDDVELGVVGCRGDNEPVSRWGSSGCAHVRGLRAQGA